MTREFVDSNNVIAGSTTSVIHIIVVAFHNSPDYVVELVRKIAHAARNAGFLTGITIVVNDASDYSSLYGTDVDVLEGQGNIGFGRAVNLGVRARPSDYILVANPDCSVNDSNMESFLARLRQGCGIVVPLFDKSPGVLDVNIYQNWVYTPTRQISRLASSRFLKHGRSDVIPRLLKAPGTFFAMETESALRLGPFDEEFFLYGEDRDLSHRARQEGIRLEISRECRVLHPGGASGATLGEAVNRSKSDSMLRIAYRRYGAPGLKLMIVNLLIEAWVKDRISGSTLLPTRVWAIRRWREKVPAQALGEAELLGNDPTVGHRR